MNAMQLMSVNLTTCQMLPWRGHERLALVEGGGRLALHAALCRLIAALGDLTVRDDGALRVLFRIRLFGQGVFFDLFLRLYGASLFVSDIFLPRYVYRYIFELRGGLCQ